MRLGQARHNTYRKLDKLICSEAGTKIGIGTRAQVFDGIAYCTYDEHTKDDLFKDAQGRIKIKK